MRQYQINYFLDFSLHLNLNIERHLTTGCATQQVVLGLSEILEVVRSGIDISDLIEIIYYINPTS